MYYAFDLSIHVDEGGGKARTAPRIPDKGYPQMGLMKKKKQGSKEKSGKGLLSKNRRCQLSGDKEITVVWGSKTVLKFAQIRPGRGPEKMELEKRENEQEDFGNNRAGGTLMLLGSQLRGLGKN